MSKRREEAEKRDHRVVGTRQKLFMFSPMSVGSAFILSHGTRIYNRLMGYMRQKYHTEVVIDLFNRWHSMIGHLIGLRGGHYTAHVSQRAVAAERPLGTLQGRHVYSSTLQRARTRASRSLSLLFIIVFYLENDPSVLGRNEPQTDELPWTLPRFCFYESVVSRSAYKTSGLLIFAPQRGCRRSAWSHEVATLHARRRAHLLPARPDWRGRF